MRKIQQRNNNRITQPLLSRDAKKALEKKFGVSGATKKGKPLTRGKLDKRAIVLNEINSHTPSTPQEAARSVLRLLRTVGPAYLYGKNPDSTSIQFRYDATECQNYWKNHSYIAHIMVIDSGENKKFFPAIIRYDSKEPNRGCKIYRHHVEVNAELNELLGKIKWMSRDHINCRLDVY